MFGLTSCESWVGKVRIVDYLSMHFLANICNVGEDGTLVSFSVDRRRGDGVPLAG